MKIRLLLCSKLFNLIRYLLVGVTNFTAVGIEIRDVRVVGKSSGCESISSDVMLVVVEQIRLSSRGELIAERKALSRQTRAVAISGN